MQTITAPRITVIPPRITTLPLNMNNAALKRVAAYARVSTDNDEQLSSYEAQMDYYTRYIQANEQWQFVVVYSDDKNVKGNMGLKYSIVQK